MNKFKLGDRVIVVDNVRTTTTQLKGLTGRVLECSDWNTSVEFDCNIDGHSCCGLGRDHFCWNIESDKLRLSVLHDLKEIRKELE